MANSIVTKPRLYLRRKDGTRSEPLKAATFHQIGGTIQGNILDLQKLNIANTIKSERWSREIINAEIQGATHELSRIENLLQLVQDDAVPLTCRYCAGRGWTDRPGDGPGRKKCTDCDGTGTVTEVERLAS